MPKHRIVNTDFFKKWTPEMAYILGFFAADGNMVRTKRNTHFISLYSADRSILLGIMQSLGSNHKLSKKSSATGCVFRFQIGSKNMFDDLVRLGLFPLKSKRMNTPQIPKKLIGDFVRGYFDGDGNVWTGFINKKRKIPTRVLQVVFTSGSMGFLKGLLSLLKAEGVRGGSLYRIKSGNYGRLSLSTLDALKLYEIMYNGIHRLFLKRKKIVFERFLRNYKYAAVA